MITDPNLVVGKEAALRNLPSACDVAHALQRLDAVALAPQQLAVLKEHACPAPAQVAQLQELMKENPHVPLALPEEYMWQISRVPAFQAVDLAAVEEATGSQANSYRNYYGLGSPEYHFFLLWACI